MTDLLKKQEEKRIVAKMIALYCHKHHHTRELCKECSQLKEYACRRIEGCPFMETKTFCSNCKVHYYETDMRQQIRIVMRYSGWRMLFHDPCMAIRHVIASCKEKKI